MSISDSITHNRLCQLRTYNSIQDSEVNNSICVVAIYVIKSVQFLLLGDCENFFAVKFEIVDIMKKFPPKMVCICILQ